MYVYIYICIYKRIHTHVSKYVRTYVHIAYVRTYLYRSMPNDLWYCWFGASIKKCVNV